MKASKKKMKILANVRLAAAEKSEWLKDFHDACKKDFDESKIKNKYAEVMVFENGVLVKHEYHH